MSDDEPRPVQHNAAPAPEVPEAARPAASHSAETCPAGATATTVMAAAVMDTAGPETGWPETAVQADGLSNVAAKDAVLPDAAVSDTAVPDATVTDAALPDAAASDTSDPDAADPAAIAPAAYIPDEDALRLAEALVFASAGPVTPRALSQLLPEAADADLVIAALRTRYAGRGVELAEAAGGVMFRTAEDLAPRLRKVVQVPRRLPRVAMETLAIIAYHQPVTRAEIEEIRGTALAQQTLEALLEAGLVMLKGRRETPGRPAMWGTTPHFLAQFGLSDLRDLPRREDLLMELPVPSAAALREAAAAAEGEAAPESSAAPPAEVLGDAPVPGDAPEGAPDAAPMDAASEADRSEAGDGR